MVSMRVTSCARRTDTTPRLSSLGEIARGTPGKNPVRRGGGWPAPHPSRRIAGVLPERGRTTYPRPQSGECLVRITVAALAVLALALPSTTAQDKQAPPKKAAAKKPPAPPVPPTAANYRYGPHERQVFDFWQAKAEAPTPLVLLIHGGGWRGGDKSGYYGAVKAYLDRGISVAAINYRYTQQAAEQGVEPPVKGPDGDAARALQTLRARAKEWNLDKARVGATG